MVEKEWKQWFRLARLDLSVAEHLYQNMYPKPYEPITFHCQQAAEKYLKGYLVFKGVEPSKIHALPLLLKECEKFSVDFFELFEKCVFMNKYAVLPRYPNELEITAEDISLVFKYTREIKVFVEEKLSDVNSSLDS